MKLHLRLFFAVLPFTPHFLAAQTSGCADGTVTGERVGIIRIGMAIAAVREHCPILRDTTEMNEGERGRGFATRDSIFAGMPLARFLDGRHPSILVGEGKVYLLDRQHCGISFGLSPEAYAKTPRLDAVALKRLPRSTTIDEILVTGITNRLSNERCS